MPTREEAKKALDSVIQKSRVHLYKPIQIAEILYRDRVYRDIDLLCLEDYRVESKKWRDEISEPLLGRVSTSSARYQDNLFNANAVPPGILNELGKENRRTDGAVEAYIYSRFSGKHSQLSKALEYCRGSDKGTFSLKKFLDAFWREAGLRRSVDKVYEIAAYALFSTLLNVLDLKVELSVGADKRGVFSEFSALTKRVMGADGTAPVPSQRARVYRVGVTNAADRGLDMYSNWGVAIQIKHLPLNEKLAEQIVGSVSGDRVVIVCKEVKESVLDSLSEGTGWKGRIQGIVTESDLVEWYEKALRGEHSDLLAEPLLDCLRGEIAREFPSVSDVPQVLKDRHYEKRRDPFWTE